MERLTEWTNKEKRVALPVAINDDGDVVDLESLCAKLAAYEDTGLEPEDFQKAFDVEAVLQLAGQALRMEPDRLRELAQADRDGRCVVLPNKAGDTVQLVAFRRGEYLGIKPHKVLGARVYMMVEGAAGEAWIEIEDFEAEASRRAKKEDTNVRHD